MNTSYWLDILGKDKKIIKSDLHFWMLKICNFRETCSLKQPGKGSVSNLTIKQLVAPNTLKVFPKAIIVIWLCFKLKNSQQLRS